MAHQNENGKYAIDFHRQSNRAMLEHQPRVLYKYNNVHCHGQAAIKAAKTDI